VPAFDQIRWRNEELIALRWVKSAGRPSAISFRTGRKNTLSHASAEPPWSCRHPAS